jgi:hypothetical protein
MKTQTTTEQLNRLNEFRQAIYHCAFWKEQAAQFELLDALSATAHAIRSFPELSLSPFFRRKWPSAYAAMERGEQDREWLTRYLSTQIKPNRDGVVLMTLDMSAWLRPDAATLPDRQLVHSSTADVTGADIVVGQPYSLLGWVAQPGASWTLPVREMRIASHQTEVEAGVAQVRAFCKARGTAALQRHLHIIISDGKYGNHRFFGPLRDSRCAELARMRCDRVLYRRPMPTPPSERGPGRPRKHGDRFAFKEPETWPAPEQHITLVDDEYGQVDIRYWGDLHALEDAATPFGVLRIQTHGERDTPPAAEWLGWQGPAYPADKLWSYYLERPTLEQSIRWRKQILHWTLPEFQSNAAADNWSTLVTVAQWQLYLARECVPDNPLPWQPPQEELTPRRVQQGLWELFLQVGTPAAAPKTRGNSPGWPEGKPRQRPQRYAVVKKGDP